MVTTNIIRYAILMRKHTQRSLSLRVLLVFHCPMFDLSVRVQMAARAPFVSLFSGDSVIGKARKLEGFLDA